MLDVWVWVVSAITTQRRAIPSVRRPLEPSFVFLQDIDPESTSGVSKGRLVMKQSDVVLPETCFTAE